jgi:uncharacterized membrane protein YqhA
MLRHLLSYSRFAVLIPVIGALIAAVGLLLYEAAILLKAAWAAAWQFASSAKDAKALAVGLVEAVDIFLIAIAMYIISLGLYVLFVDDTLALPKWLEIRNLDDLKRNLVSVVIVVLAVLFLREALTRPAGYDLLAFGGGLALVIGSLTFYLGKGDGNKH